MIEDVVKKLVFDVILKAAISKIIAAVPFLAWPVINPLFVYIVTKVATRLYEEMETHVQFTLIDLKTKAELEAYNKAVAELKAAHAAPIIDQKEIENAKQKFKATLGNLIRINPV